MPIRKQDYHPDWTTIATGVKNDAGWKCEWCGLAHGAIIRRGKNGAFTVVEHITETTGEIIHTKDLPIKRLQYHGLTKIVLTVAHLDRNSANNDRDNLACLCQRDHLSHDILQHVTNRRYGRYHKREHQFKLI